MTKEQQAQMIASIRERVNQLRGQTLYRTQVDKDREYLMDLVDFQAQKIAEQAKEIERLKSESKKINTDEQIAQEFWLRGYVEAHIENRLTRPEMFSDGFSADWFDTYGAEFSDGAFIGKFVEVPR